MTEQVKTQLSVVIATWAGQIFVVNRQHFRKSCELSDASEEIHDKAHSIIGKLLYKDVLKEDDNITFEEITFDGSDVVINGIRRRFVLYVGRVSEASEAKKFVISGDSISNVDSHSKLCKQVIVEAKEWLREHKREVSSRRC